jgi:MFS family permease
LRAKLGLPALAGNARFVVATAVDSVGTGLILAFSVVYFVKTTHVPLAQIGAAITLARLLALPTSVAVGPLIDRFTARRTAATGNLISFLGYSGFLLAHHSWSITVVAFLVQIGHTTYWTSSAALVALAVPPERRPRWFGFLYALRNTGMGVGSALAAFAFTLGAVTGLHLITISNALSYLVAAGLLFRWHPAAEPSADKAAVVVPDHERVDLDQEAVVPAPRTGYRTVLRDREYTLLIGVNFTLVFAQMLIKVLLAIYIVEALDRGAWIAGTLIVVSTVQIALTQTVLSRYMERYRVTRVVGCAAVLNAAAFGLFAALYTAPDRLVIVGLFVAMFIFTTGEIIGFPAMDNLSVALAPEFSRGRYLAVFQLSWTTGEVFAPVVLTYLLARGATLPMLFLLVLSLAALPALMVLGSRAEAATAVPIPA